MSTWLRNFKTALENKEVVILHGNVRDKYINCETGLVCANLTELLQEVARELPLSFSRLIFYDMVGQERKKEPKPQSPPPLPGPPRDGPSEAGELAATSPPTISEQKAPPSRVLARWAKEMAMSQENVLAAIFYLDKLVSYKTGYQPDERETLLRLEKLIENITPNNRLIMVALQDSMVPVELYTNSPKVALIQIPVPDKQERNVYLEHRLGPGRPHNQLVADLTEGLFLRDLDSVARLLGGTPDADTRQIRRVVNKYRLGEQQDYWGTLDIEKLNSAFRWFVDEEGVKGQDEAVKRVIEVMTLARAGLSGMASGTPAKPKGVLFFAGPTGVGKTFLAKKLAKFLFGSEEAFIRFDMSEFKEEHTDSKLIGSPPGYVGYERGGMLTGSVREKPFSVVLFDEIEKAHPKIMDIFLQVLDEGRLTDSRGQTVFFTETVIVFTSNIGTRTRDSRGSPLNERVETDVILKNPELNDAERHEKIQQHFSRAVRDFFLFEISRPELLNRIGNNIVPFNYIDSNAIQMEIIRSHFARTRADFEDRFKSQRHCLEFDSSVIDYLVNKYSDNICSFGGRAITNAIEDEVMKALSRAVLKAEYSSRPGLLFRLAVTNGSITVES